MAGAPLPPVPHWVRSAGRSCRPHPQRKRGGCRKLRWLRGGAVERAKGTGVGVMWLTTNLDRGHDSNTVRPGPTLIGGGLRVNWQDPRCAEANGDLATASG